MGTSRRWVTTVTARGRVRGRQAAEASLRALLVTALVAIAGCGGDDRTVGAPSPEVAPTTDERGVAVEVLGVLSAADRLCPLAQPACRAALTIEGAVGDVAVGDAVRGRGWYDGRRVQLAAPLRPTTSPFVELDLSTMCPGLSNPTAADGDAGVEATRRLLYGDSPVVPGSHPALAMTWIDPTTHVMNYWFAHDLERYESAIVAAFAPHAVCVEGGATYSEQELDQASRAVAALAAAGGYAIGGGFSVTNRSNRIAVPFEAIDQEGQAAVEALGPVIAVPFLELLDRPIVALPRWQSAETGDVHIITARSRSDRGGLALGSFTLLYDAALNCVFASTPDGGRMAVIWPFGSTARRDGDGAVVFGATGHEIARTGRVVELGGGTTSNPEVFADVDDAQRCGATSFWIVGG